MAAVFPSSWWVKAALCTHRVRCLESAGAWSNLYLASAPEVERAGWDTRRVTLPWQIFHEACARGAVGSPRKLQLFSSGCTTALPPGKQSHLVARGERRCHRLAPFPQMTLERSSFEQKEMSHLRDKPRHPSGK